MKMRILISLLLVFLSVMTGYADNYFKEGTVWTVEKRCSDDPEILTIYKYFFDGAVEYNGDTLLQMKESIDGGSPHPYCLIKSEGEKVWINYGVFGQILLYDFGIREGETVEVGYIDFDMDGKAPEMFELTYAGDKSAKEFGYDGDVMEMKEEYSSGWWVNGIGGYSGPLCNCNFDLDGLPSWLVKVEHEGEVLFVNTLTRVQNTSTDNKKDNVYYRLDGTRTDEPHNGIFIKEGRKLIIR